VYRPNAFRTSSVVIAVKRFFSPALSNGGISKYVTRQLELGVPMVDLASYRTKILKTTAASIPAKDASSSMTLF